MSDHRAELRRALHDALATIRVLNASARLAIDERDRAELVAARIDLFAVARSLLAQLHPCIAPQLRKRHTRKETL